MTDDTPLSCACCGSPMTPAEAMPAPDGLEPALYYHADFQACVRVALSHLANAKPHLRAMLGAADAHA